MPDPLHDLLHAAKQSPADDAPRAAVADHLAAADPDRAEFVRVQLRQGGGLGWYPHRPADDTAAARLVKRHARDWAGAAYAGPHGFAFADSAPDPDDDHPHAVGQFERGLLRVGGSPAEVRAALDRVPSAGWVETLDLSGVRTATEVRAVADHPAGREVTAFDVSLDDSAPADALDPLDAERVRVLRAGGTGGAVVRRLAGFRLARPHTLSVECPPADPAAADALFASPLLAEVGELEVSVDGPPAEVLAALARGTHLRRLRRLTLSGDALPAAGLRAVFAADAVRGLRRLSVSGYGRPLHGVLDALVRGGAATELADLDLGFNAVCTAEAEALARCGWLGGVKRLSFAGGELSAAGAVALAGSPHAAGLERLDLSGTGVGEEAVVALAASPHLANLRELDLGRCGVTAKAVRAVAQSEHLANLRRLDLSANPLPPFSLDALAGSRTLGGLKCLGLRHLTLSNDTFDRLLRSPVMAGVEELDLHGAVLSKAKVLALVDATALGGLRKLTLGENVLMRGEIDPLGDAGWLPGVLALTLAGTKMTDEGVRRVVAAVPDGTLGALDLSHNLLTDDAADLLLSWTGLGGLADIELHASGVGDEHAGRVRRAVWGNQ